MPSYWFIPIDDCDVDAAPVLLGNVVLAGERDQPAVTVHATSDPVEANAWADSLAAGRAPCIVYEPLVPLAEYNPTRPRPNLVDG